MGLISAEFDGQGRIGNNGHIPVTNDGLLTRNVVLLEVSIFDRKDRHCEKLNLVGNAAFMITFRKNRKHRLNLD